MINGSAFMWSRILDTLSPRQCLICAKRLSISERYICGACTCRLPRANHILDPYDNQLTRLLRGHASVHRAASLFLYKPGSDMTRLLFAFKYHNHPEVAVMAGHIMAGEFAAAGFFSGIDMLVPVPLTQGRQRWRGYNQSEKICRGISDVTHLPVCRESLIRLSFEQSQTRLSVQDRTDNVSRAFSAKETISLEGKHILLVDDVITSGATMTACVKALEKTPRLLASAAALCFTHH